MQSETSCYSGIRVLVLGATGFIGRWVARSLTQCGADLFLVVRTSSNAERVFPAYGIQGQVIELDLRQAHMVRRAIEKIQPSITFNLVGYGVDRSETNEQDFQAIHRALPRSLCELLGQVKRTGWKGM